VGCRLAVIDSQKLRELIVSVRHRGQPSHYLVRSGC